MDELKRIVASIDKHSTNTNSLLSLSDEATLETKLYYLLKEGVVNSDIEAAQELYGVRKLTSSFRMLKSRFKKKLYNHLLFLEPTSFSSANIHTASYQCNLLINKSIGLRLISERKLALKLLDQAQEIAFDFEMNDAKIQVLEEKRLLYMNFNMIDQYVECENLLLDCYHIQVHEREALSLYDHTMMSMRGTTSERTKLFKDLPNIIIKLQELYHATNSPKIYHQSYVLQVLYLEQIGDYKEIVKAADDAEKLIRTGGLNKGWFTLGYISFTKIYALLQSRLYKQGLDYAASNVVYFTKYNANWFGFLENYVLLALHYKSYSLTESLLIEVTANKYFEKLQQTSRERWELYRRYFLLMHKFSAQGSAMLEPPKVVEELTVLPKDKAGFNLALLVLDVFESLSNSDLERLELHAERVRKYTSKYLKGEKALRPRLFMRMLQVALQEQSLRTVRQKTESMLEQLQQTPLPGDAFAEVEVIPYEHLWELVPKLR